jgi:hypothetical protein
MLFTVEFDDCPIPLVQLIELFARHNHAICSDGNGRLTAVRKKKIPGKDARTPRSGSRSLRSRRTRLQGKRKQQ